MRIQVDRDLCQGHGVCKEEAPQVFDVEGDTVVVLQEAPGNEQREAVKLAVKYCPTRALSVED
jgi:ferredoxin